MKDMKKNSLCAWVYVCACVVCVCVYSICAACAVFGASGASDLKAVLINVFNSR